MTCCELFRLVLNATICAHFIFSNGMWICLLSSSGHGIHSHHFHFQPFSALFLYVISKLLPAFVACDVFVVAVAAIATNHIDCEHDDSERGRTELLYQERISTTTTRGRPTVGTISLVKRTIPNYTCDVFHNFPATFLGDARNSAGGTTTRGPTVGTSLRAVLFPSTRGIRPRRIHSRSSAVVGRNFEPPSFVVKNALL